MAKKGVLEHPKTLTLADSLGIMDCFALGILEAFWHHVTDYYEDGDVTNLRPAVFARSIRYQGNGQELWAALIYAGFIDETPEGRLLVHDWPEHCNDYLHTRFFRAFKRFADGTMPKPGSVGKDERERLLKQWEIVENSQQKPDLNLQIPKQSENNLEIIPEQSQNALPSLAIPSLAIPSHMGVNTQLVDQKGSENPPNPPGGDDEIPFHFVKPTPMQVIEYLVAQGYRNEVASRSAERFHRHQKGRSWAGVRDWRPLAINWIDEDLAKASGRNSARGGSPPGSDFEAPYTGFLLEHQPLSSAVEEVFQHWQGANLGKAKDLSRKNTRAYLDELLKVRATPEIVLRHGKSARSGDFIPNALDFAEMIGKHVPAPPLSVVDHEQSGFEIDPAKRKFGKHVIGVGG